MAMREPLVSIELRYSWMPYTASTHFLDKYLRINGKALTLDIKSYTYDTIQVTFMLNSDVIWVCMVRYFFNSLSYVVWQHRCLLRGVRWRHGVDQYRSFNQHFGMTLQWPDNAIFFNPKSWSWPILDLFDQFYQDDSAMAR